MIAAVDQYVKEFSQLMSVEADVSCTLSQSDSGDQRVISITYNGQDLGYMIGNHGAHLRGLQFILSMLINKKFASEEERFYVNVDVSGYKKSKLDKVERIAMRLADDARILGEPVDMEPMSAAERRVVHMTLSKFDDISTESYGEGQDRFVRIIPKSEKQLGLMDESEVDDILGTDDLTEE